MSVDLLFRFEHFTPIYPTLYSYTSHDYTTQSPTSVYTHSTLSSVPLLRLYLTLPLLTFISSIKSFFCLTYDLWHIIYVYPPNTDTEHQDASKIPGTRSSLAFLTRRWMWMNEWDDEWWRQTQTAKSKAFESWRSKREEGMRTGFHYFTDPQTIQPTSHPFHPLLSLLCSVLCPVLRTKKKNFTHTRPFQFQRPTEPDRCTVHVHAVNCTLSSPVTL